MQERTEQREKRPNNVDGDEDSSNMFSLSPRYASGYASTPQWSKPEKFSEAGQKSVQTDLSKLKDLERASQFVYGAEWPPTEDS